MADFVAEQSAALIVLVPLIASFITLLVNRIKSSWCYFWTCFILLTTFILSLATLYRVVTVGPVSYHFGGWLPPWGIEYAADHLNSFVATVISLVSLLTVIYSKKSIEQELPGKESYFYTVTLLLITGLLGIVVTGDMFNLYVFIEISALAAYALIAIGDKKAPMSSFNYLVMGTIGACFYLIGVGYLYMATGTLNMADLATRLPEVYNSKVTIVGLSFCIVGLAIKMGLFPLHLWMPDAYTHAPSAVSPLIAATMTKVFAYVFIRILFTIFQPEFVKNIYPITNLLSWLAVGAIIFGSIWAIAQNNLKRMLAYSSMAQIGYIVLGITLVNRFALTGGMLHILFHALMKGCLFLTAGAIIYRTGVSDIRQLQSFNLSRKMPITVWAFSIASLSMMGIPPTCGFFSKWYLIIGATQTKEWLFLGAILIGTLLSAIYFFRVLEKLWLPPNNSDYCPSEPLVRTDAPISMLFPILIMAAGILLLGFFTGQIVDTILYWAVPKNL